ncbi:MAG: hypothetical protein K2X70_09295, partial [Candidatus Obscuribacterales bacterium]|nr:hypothetical protein [Candidatus Obscuribacterales bacterium]
MVKNEKKSVRVSLWAAQNRFLFSNIYYSKQCLIAFLVNGQWGAWGRAAPLILPSENSRVGI